MNSKLLLQTESPEEFNKFRIRNGAYYKNLNIEYHYNKYDFDFSRYMNKMHAVFKKIDTPFVMVFDNDDLIDLSGIRRGVHFLSNNLEYSCYRNDIRTLEINADTSDINIGESLYTKDSIEQDHPDKRLCDVIKNFNSFNYAVFRTATLQFFFELMDSVSDGDFQIFDKSWAYISAIFGKCKRLTDESYYYFIPGNSVLQSGDKIHKFNEWMATPYWQRSPAIMISIISRVYNHLYGKDIREMFSVKFFDEAISKNKEKIIKIDSLFEKAEKERSSGEIASAIKTAQEAVHLQEQSGVDSVEYLNDKAFSKNYMDISFSYDKTIDDIIQKYDFSVKSYDCEETPPSSNHEFVKWLST